MRYLCLVVVDPSRLVGLSAEEHRAITRDSIDYDRRLTERGELVIASALAEPRTATMVAVRGDEVLFTDGPFTELTEFVGGLLIVDVPDQERALAIAAALPMARYGRIEVRALRSISAD